MDKAHKHHLFPVQLRKFTAEDSCPKGKTPGVLCRTLLASCGCPCGPQSGFKPFHFLYKFQISSHINITWNLPFSLIQVLDLKVFFQFPSLILLGNIRPLVIVLLTTRQPDLYLHQASLKVHPQRNQSIALFLDLAAYF